MRARHLRPRPCPLDRNGTTPSNWLSQRAREMLNSNRSGGRKQGGTNCSPSSRSRAEEAGSGLLGPARRRIFSGLKVKGRRPSLRDALHTRMGRVCKQCQGPEEGKMLTGYKVSGLQGEWSSGDWMDNKVNELNATEKRLRW